jgi:hypothetical protein
VDDAAQAKALRLRLYVLCSECARLIDFADGNQQQRDVAVATLSGTLLVKVAHLLLSFSTDRLTA